MLTQGGGSFHIEFIERDRARKFAAAGKIGNSVGDLFQVQTVRHVDNFRENVVRPVGVAVLFERQQQDAAAHGGALPHESLSLFIGRKA